MLASNEMESVIWREEIYFTMENKLASLKDALAQNFKKCIQIYQPGFLKMIESQSSFWVLFLHYCQNFYLDHQNRVGPLVLIAFQLFPPAVIVIFSGCY